MIQPEPQLVVSNVNKRLMRNLYKKHEGLSLFHRNLFHYSASTSGGGSN